MATLLTALKTAKKREFCYRLDIDGILCAIIGYLHASEAARKSKYYYKFNKAIKL